jgi:hypothetical protein
MVMPWKKAKARAAEYRSGKRDVKQLTALFDACFRIQREACQAAGRHIPLVVENVRGAIPWVGRSRWNFGSYHLWGDTPALMPALSKAAGVKAPGMNWSDQTKRGQDFTRIAGRHAIEGVKLRDQDGYQRSHPNAFGWKAPRTSSGAKARKFASAMIAKIPLPLSRHIAATYLPTQARAA